MFFGIFLTLALPVFLGGVIASPFHRFRGLAGWLAAGCVTGLILFTGISFLLSFFLNAISWKVIVLTNLTLCLFALVVRKASKGEKNLRWEDHTQNVQWLRVVSVAIVGCLGFLVVASMCAVLSIKPNGYYVEFANNFGDLGLHIHYISSFRYADNFPSLNPAFSGVPLRYPFLSDFYSAVVWFATDKLEYALELPGMILGLSFLVLFYQWTMHLTRSQMAGALAPLLFLCGGSTGFLYWVRDLVNRKASGQNILPQTYSMIGSENLHWPNVIHALIVPQRGLQFAFPLVIFLCALTFDAAKNKNARVFLFVALLAGLMPFVHGHALIALSIFGILVFVRYPSRNWVALLLPLFFIWLPQVLFLAQKIGPEIPGSKGFVRFSLGWMDHGVKSFGFWLRNTGLFLPLSLAVFWIVKKGQSETRLLAIVGFVLFALGNLVIVAPWEWDNIKILIFWVLFTLPLVSLGIVHLFERRKIWFTICGFVLVVSLTWTGVLDLYHALGTKLETHSIYTRIKHQSDLKVARWIRENLPKDAVFLAAPTPNQPLQLTGRPVVLGYLGHIWSHGLPSEPRTSEVLHMLQGKEGTLDLLKKYDVSYVLYGSRERDYEKKFNKDFFDRNFEPYHAVGGFVIYKVKGASPS